MERQAYDRRSFRNLPREQCAVSLLFGDMAGPCRGLIHLHHVDPQDPGSRLVEVCNAHHQHLHKTIRTLTGAPQRAWKRCRHHHPTPEGREACERRLNSDMVAR